MPKINHLQNIEIVTKTGYKIAYDALHKRYVGLDPQDKLFTFENKIVFFKTKEGARESAMKRATNSVRMQMMPTARAKALKVLGNELYEDYYDTNFVQIELKHSKLMESFSKLETEKES